ncbi:MAG: nitrite reductase [Nitrospirota bacterium]|nr:nitrite reductase [Nitrospirota bacterium]
MKKWLYMLPVAAIALSAGFASANEVKVSDEEMSIGKKAYFDRCSGCHGTLRKGATGPNLEPKRTTALGTDALKVFLEFGTPGGMPSFKDMLTEKERDIMARFLQVPAPLPPEMSLAEMKESWKVLVPVDKRPSKPQHNRNWKNYFGVILRDAGKAAVIDGDTKELVGIVDTGFAVHILRSSASGRYMYSIGRDGKATIFDLWTDKPTMVAEVKVGSDARSIDSSKYKGFEDKYAIIGDYWPPQFIILDGQTLEPIKVVSTRSMTYDTNEYHPEPRVAAIIASHIAPEWMLNIKETGYIWIVDYSDLKNLKITQLEAERFLHDGGWASDKRHFLMAANMRNRVVVVDTKNKNVPAIVDVGTKPHPGRGANWDDSKFGPVWATPHLGEPALALIGTDPVNHKANAWKMVKKVPVLGAGGLFVKTHPKSDRIWVDSTLDPDPEKTRSLTILNKKNLDEPFKTIKVADHGRVVHLEYNDKGDEVWVSVWDKKGEIVVYDDKTMKEKKRITGDWLVTPTGKFNVTNTVGDIY